MKLPSAAARATNIWVTRERAIENTDSKANTDHPKHPNF